MLPFCPLLFLFYPLPPQHLDPEPNLGFFHPCLLSHLSYSLGDLLLILPSQWVKVGDLSNCVWSAAHWGQGFVPIKSLHLFLMKKQLEWNQFACFPSKKGDWRRKSISFYLFFLFSDNHNWTIFFLLQKYYNPVILHHWIFVQGLFKNLSRNIIFWELNR